ncbi:cell division protein FtsQ/DivIB [Luteimicrobium sp. NPDC057192]|uniref:cell division protein FtsQ/DivIB n=1 Tax=Luteimicrobium sp. NPDC057192 TaxID=3346042 RepID=UPI003636F43F
MPSRPPSRPSRPRPAPLRDRDRPASASAGAGPVEPAARDDAPRSAPPTAPTSQVPRTEPRTGSVPVRRGPASVPVPVVAARGSVVSTGMVDRLAERAAMRRHRRWRRLAWTLAVLAAVGALVWLAFFSPVLATRAEDVRVVGAGSLVDTAEVEHIAAGADGVPLPRLDTVSLRTRMLDVRGVKDVSIVRDWPHGLTVRVTPREPVAAVPDQGRFALLDADGVRVATVGSAPKGVPVVTVPLDAADHHALDAVLAVLGGLPDALGTQVTAAQASTQDTVELTLRKGVRVVWGSSQDSALKVRVLEALRSAKQTKHASVFDVSAPTLPVTR